MYLGRDCGLSIKFRMKEGKAARGLEVENVICDVSVLVFKVWLSVLRFNYPARESGFGAYAPRCLRNGNSKAVDAPWVLVPPYIVHPQP